MSSAATVVSIKDSGWSLCSQASSSVIVTCLEIFRMGKTRSFSLAIAFLLLLLRLASTQATYHIRPTSNSPCPHEDCLTLSEYASQNRSHSNSDNLTLVFRPGEHILNTSIDFQLLYSMTLLGNDSFLPNITSKIACRESSAFALQSIHSVEIKALAFVSCGGFDNSTSSPKFTIEYDTVEVQNVFPALSAELVLNLHLVSCQFQNNFLPLFLNKTEAYTRDNEFTGNTGGLGGAVAAYNSTISFLGQNHFINNQAEIGGGIFANNSKLVITGSIVFHANNATYAGGGIGIAYSTLTFGEAVIANEAAQNQTDLQGACTVLLDNSTSGQNAQIGSNKAEHRSIFPSSFSDVLFTENKGNGGAIFTKHSDLTSINTNMTFVKNIGLFGGAIYSKTSRILFGMGSRTGPRMSCSSALIGHVFITFRRNFATNQGAFMAVRSIVLFNDNTTFEQNQESAISIVRSDIEFSFGSHTTFIGNEGSDGAGIYASQHSNLQFSGEVQFFRNRARVCGGGIHLYTKSLLILNGTGTFINNSAADSGGVFSISYSSTIRIFSGDITMAMNSAGSNGGAMSVDGTIHIFSGDITMAMNSAGSNGGAMSVDAYGGKHFIYGRIDFLQNWAEHNGGAVHAKNSKLYIDGLYRFEENEARNNGQGGAIYAEDTQIILSGSYSINNNSAMYGGGIACTADLESNNFLSFSFLCKQETIFGTICYNKISSQLILRGTGTFIDNSAAVSGGVFHISYGSTIDIDGANITMAMNSAGRNGGAMSVESTKETHFIDGRINFLGNFAENNGGAVYANCCKLTLSGLYRFEDNAARNNGYGGAIHAEETQITLSGSYNFTNNSAMYGGAINAEDSQLTLNGSYSINNNSAMYGGAIHAKETDLLLRGSYNFTNNSARYGGGMAITSYMDHFFFLEPNTSVFFRDNHAQYGGAMFVEDNEEYYCYPGLAMIGRNCFITFDTFTRLYEPQREYIYVNNSRLLEYMGHMEFEDNYAEEGGTAIYGGALHNCRVDTHSSGSCSYEPKCQTRYTSGLEAIATLTQMSVEQLTLDPLNILSNTYRVCICDSQQRPNYRARYVDYTAYPGETTSLPLAAVDHENHKIVSAVIHAEVDNETGEVWLGPLQNTQPITKYCTELGYTLFSRGTRSARLLLSAEGQCRSPGIPLVVHMDFLPCPFGFSLSQSGSCICEKRLQKYTNSCDINGRTFTRNGDFWLGFDSHGAILHPHCPFDYCELETVSFTHNSTDLQCANGRSGILCGACKSGDSLNLGSSHCSACSNVYLLLFLPFAIAGFLLVIFLFVCKVTVAAGTTSGLIFYANVLAVNRSVFFPSSETNILTVFIAWLNLDLGIETCLLDGLDVYTWMWLQFVFPIYIWTLVGLIALVSYYSTNFARIIGPTNPISVLATLFLLSYTKLLRTIIATFSFTTLDYPNDRKVTVWVYDGNIGYLEGKHIPLFLTGLLAFLFLFLPYTLLLLFGQCIEAGSNHRLLSWANNPKIRSFLDAYHAPYKNRHRYWTGLLLLLRFVLFIISAVVDINSPRDPSINLLVLGITMFGLSVWAWNIGSMHRKWYNNALESSFILNLGILALASYQVKVEGGNQAAVVYTSVSVAFVTFLGIIAYHVLQRVVDSRIWRHSAVRSKLNRLKDNRRQHQDPIEMAVPPTAPHPHPVATTFVDLRESLLESQH